MEWPWVTRAERDFWQKKYEEADAEIRAYHWKRSQFIDLLRHEQAELFARLERVRWAEGCNPPSDI